MQFFANLTSAAPDPIEFALRASEEAGFDGVACSDHYWLRSVFPHVWVTLSAMACATERVTLAPSFANNLFRSPSSSPRRAPPCSGCRRAATRPASGRVDGPGDGGDRPGVPGGRIRARMYREALLMVRELLTTGRLPVPGRALHDGRAEGVRRCRDPPPLVASVGSPWTMRNITPIVDRVELKFGRTTRGGALDMQAMASHPRRAGRHGGRGARAAPDIAVGLFLLIRAGGRSVRVQAISDALGDNLCGAFVGEPRRVLDNLRGLEELGISRIRSPSW